MIDYQKAFIISSCFSLYILEVGGFQGSPGGFQAGLGEYPEENI